MDDELDRIVRALGAVRDGDLSVRLPADASNAAYAEIARAFNAMVERLGGSTTEVTRLLGEMSDGRFGGTPISAPEATGAWAVLVERTNALATSLTDYVREVSGVTRSVARGVVSETLTVDARGELLELKEVINTMVQQLRVFATETNRIMSELAADGKISAQSAASGMSGVWKDLSDNVSLAEQLAALSRYKSEFLANMSHELRTPLNSMLILARLLAENREANLTPKQVEYAQTIYGAGGDLLSLINDILDLSKVEAGKMHIEASEMRFSELKTALERTFGAVAEQRSLAWSVEIAPDVPPHIHTDPQRLHQILKNLISNAIKFTDAGGVTLRIARAPGEAAIAFAVTDTGIGVSAEDRARIFEPFHQADAMNVRQAGGTGLGLSISRAISTLLGGDLLVESEVGRGSTFTLVLPERAAWVDEPKPARSPVVAPSPPRAPAVVGSSDASPDQSLAGRKALVVDDDIRNVFALAGVLDAHGLKVIHAERGKLGIEALKSNADIDVVLMDVMMPELDGYETMRAIRADPHFASIPIIAVTARALPGDRALCIAAGASDYLAKPVRAPELLAMMSRLLLT